MSLRNYVICLCLHRVSVTQVFWVFFGGFFFFCFFQGCTRSIWRFPGQGSNQICSCWPTPQPQKHQILNPLIKTRDASSCILVRFVSIEPTMGTLRFFFQVEVLSTKFLLETVSMKTLFSYLQFALPYTKRLMVIFNVTSAF